MHKHFEKYLNVKKILTDTKPRTVVELGVGGGRNSRMLQPLCVELNARLILVSDNPNPCEDMEWDYRQGISWEIIPTLENVDFAIVDTTHTGEVVQKELDALAKIMKPGAVVLAHDTTSHGGEYSKTLRSHEAFRTVREVTESNGAIHLVRR